METCKVCPWKQVKFVQKVPGEVLVLIGQQGPGVLSSLHFVMLCPYLRGYSTFRSYFFTKWALQIFDVNEAKNASSEDWPPWTLNSLKFCGNWFIDKKCWPGTSWVCLICPVFKLQRPVPLFLVLGEMVSPPPKIYFSLQNCTN